MVFGPIELLILALPAVAALIVLIVIAVRRSRRQGSADGGTCGKCGYNVRGIGSTTCPECGADLREVRIVAEKRGGAGPWIVAAVIVGVLLFGCVCSGLLVFGVRAAHVGPTVPVQPAPPTAGP